MFPSVFSAAAALVERQQTGSVRKREAENNHRDASLCFDSKMDYAKIYF